MLPAFAGLLTEIADYCFDIQMMPLYAFALVTWAIAVLACWRQRERRLAAQWHMLGCQDEEDIRPGESTICYVFICMLISHVSLLLFRVQTSFG